MGSIRGFAVIVAVMLGMAFPAVAGTVEDLRAKADRGDAAAQYSLGQMYSNGDEGLPKDPEQAVRWWRLAAEQGHPLSQYRLGLMYRFGKGVTKDYVQAYKWVSLAASRFPPDYARLESVIRDRENIPKLMSAAQIAEAQKLIEAWEPKPSGAN